MVANAVDTSGSLWELIRQVAVEEGVELFDLDTPSGGDGESGGRGGILRVYITRSAAAAEALASQQGSGSDSGRGSDSDESESEDDLAVELGEGSPRGGISFADCTRLAKRLLDIDEERGIIPEGWVLEVSSPGVNRRLRRPEHFDGAVGERVRVKYRNEKGTGQVITGDLEAVRGGVLVVRGEGAKEVLEIKLPDIKEARVDFKFD